MSVPYPKNARDATIAPPLYSVVIMFHLQPKLNRAEWREIRINTGISGMPPRPHLPTGISHFSAFLISHQEIESDYRFDMPFPSLAHRLSGRGADWN